MITLKTPVRTVYDASNAAIGLAEFQTDEVIAIVHGGTGSNTIAGAKLSLSLTDSNIRSLLSVTGSGTYDNATGIITVTGGVTSVGGATGTVSNAQVAAAVVAAGSLDTANVTERNNLYFTNARARLAVSATGSINYDNTTGVISFTQGNTDTIVEGVSNLYFNNTRARSAFTAGAGIDITSGIISVASTIDYGLIDGAITTSNDYGSIL
jgi:hypothetical protein